MPYAETVDKKRDARQIKSGTIAFSTDIKEETGKGAILKLNVEEVADKVCPVIGAYTQVNGTVIDDPFNTEEVPYKFSFDISMVWQTREEAQQDLIQWSKYLSQHRQKD